jgi:hypothetical protein
MEGITYRRPSNYLAHLFREFALIWDVDSICMHYTYLTKHGKSMPHRLTVLRRYLGAGHSRRGRSEYVSSPKPALHWSNFKKIHFAPPSHFLNTLDPNLSAAPKEFTPRSNTTIFWPQWQAPSPEGSTSLLTSAIRPGSI